LGVFGSILLNEGNYTGIVMGLNPDTSFHVFVPPSREVSSYAGRALGPRILQSVNIPLPLQLKVSATFGSTRSVTIQANSLESDIIHTIHYVAISRVEEDDELKMWSPAIGEQILASRIGVDGVASRGNLTRSESSWWTTSICGLATDMPLEIFVCPEIRHENRSFFGAVQSKLVRTAEIPPVVLSYSASPRVSTASDIEIQVEIRPKGLTNPNVYWAAVSDSSKITSLRSDEIVSSTHRDIVASGMLNTSISTNTSSTLVYSSIISLHDVMFPTTQQREYRVFEQFDENTNQKKKINSNKNNKQERLRVPPTFNIHIAAEAYPTGSAATRDVTIPFVPVQVFGAAPKWIYLNVIPEPTQSDTIQVSVTLDSPSLLFYIAIESENSMVDDALSNKTEDDEIGRVLRNLVETFNCSNDVNNNNNHTSCRTGSIPFDDKNEKSLMHSFNITKLRPCTSYDVWILPDVLGRGRKGGYVFGSAEIIRKVQTHCRPATVNKIEATPTSGSTVNIDLVMSITPSHAISVVHTMLVSRDEVKDIPTPMQVYVSVCVYVCFLSTNK